MRGSDIAASAARLLGVRWKRNGRSPSGLDCSGLCVVACSLAGLDLQDYHGQYDSAFPDPKIILDTLAKNGEAISPSEAKPGMLFLSQVKGMKGATHLGVYAENGDIIHMDPMGRKVVQVRPDSIRGRIVAAIKLNGVQY